MFVLTYFQLKRNRNQQEGHESLIAKLDVHFSLSFGYNVAKGFITAEEEVSKLIETICDDRAVHAKLFQMCVTNRLEVLKEMGESEIILVIRHFGVGREVS